MTIHMLNGDYPITFVLTQSGSATTEWPSGREAMLDQPSALALLVMRHTLRLEEPQERTR